METSVSEPPAVFGDATNAALASPPQSLKVTRRSRSRRSNRSRSTLADSPGGEPSDSSDALASRLHGHVDSAAALRLAATEVSAQLGQLSYDALRERIDHLARLATQLHTELHSEWRCALLSTADGAAAARAAAKLNAVEMHATEGGEAEAPARRPSVDAFAGLTSSPFDETLPLPTPLLALEPVAEVEDAAADGAPRAKGAAANGADAGASAGGRAGAEVDARSAFERPPPVIVPPPASAHPPCTPPAVRSAPADRPRGGGMPPSPALRPAALSCGGGGLGLPSGGFGAAAGALPPPFVPLTISALAVQRVRASAAARPPLGTPGGGLRTPHGSHAGTPRAAHAGALPPYAAGTPRQSQRASVATPTAARSAAAAGAAWAASEPWGRGAAAAAFMQARARGWLARKRWLAPLRRQLKRAAVAAELAASEARFCAIMQTLVDAFVRPLEAAGAAGERAAREIFANARVLANVSSLFLAALKPAVAELRPARAVAAALQAHVPLFKTYRPYVAAFARAQTALEKARGAGALGALLRDGEAKAGASLESLLIQPIQRVPRYKLLVERLLQLTEPAAPEHAQLQEVLLRVAELCAAVNDSAAEAESAAKVAALARELGIDERSQLLPGGLAQPHRRFVMDGGAVEHPLAPSIDEGAAGWAAAAVGAAAGPRAVRLIMFNDILLVASAGLLAGFAARDALSLAKARVRALPDPADGCAGPRHAFELCVGRKARVFAAPTADAKHAWVKAVRKQVGALLDRFKARGRSLAFLPQNVAMLRKQLQAAESERAAVEAQVCAISEELCSLEAQVVDDRRRRDAAEREVGGTAEASSERLAALLQTVFEADLAISRSESRRSLLQSQIGHHVARLSQISEMLELTAAKHDGDSLLQFMLFQSN